jgi:hypothetical protein
MSASRWPKWLPSTKKANWPPGPCANFQEITMESMPVFPFENTLTTLTPDDSSVFLTSVSLFGPFKSHFFSFCRPVFRFVLCSVLFLSFPRLFLAAYLGAFLVLVVDVLIFSSMAKTVVHCTRVEAGRDRSSYSVGPSR